MKCHRPDVFLCALLNAQPMGFYAPAQLVRDARAHGVEVRPVDVNHSRWDSTLEAVGGDRHAVRLGLRCAKGFANADGARIVAARGERPYTSITDLWRRAGVASAQLVRLARADAFGSLSLSRREALWAIKALRDDPLPLFAAADAREGQLQPEFDEPAVILDPMTLGQEVVEDYRNKGFSLRRHPLSFLRGDLEARGIAPCAALAQARDRSRITVAGLVLVRQMPGLAKGVMFITLEDETDVANLVIWPSLLERQRRLVLSAAMLGCRGRGQRGRQVVYLVAEHLVDPAARLRTVGMRDEPLPLPRGRGDEASGGGGPDERVPALGRRVQDIFIPDLHVESGLKVRAREFR